MDSVDISVIVPIYNVEHYIDECMRSVAVQTAAGTLAIECLLVDDCSTDGSIDTVNRFVYDYDGSIDFKMIAHSRNSGLGAARNSGIRQAKGQYVFFLDSDDVITPDCLELLWRVRCKWPHAEIICGDFETFPVAGVHESISLRNKKFPEFSDDKEFIRSIFLSTFPVTSWNKLIDRQFILRNSLFFREDIIHEDNHWQGLAYPFVSSIAIVNSVTYCYRIREHSITNEPEILAKKARALYSIYHEMTVRHIEWDKYWTMWIAEGLMWLKKNAPSNCEDVDIKALISAVNDNPSIPKGVKRIFSYLKLPAALQRYRVIRTLLSLYFSIVGETTKHGRVNRDS